MVVSFQRFRLQGRIPSHGQDLCLLRVRDLGFTGSGFRVQGFTGSAFRVGTLNDEIFAASVVKPGLKMHVDCRFPDRRSKPGHRP